MKRKLLLAALIVAGALGFNANAEVDVTASYIGDVTKVIKAGGHNCSNNHKLKDAGYAEGEGYFNTQDIQNGPWHNFGSNGDYASTNGIETWTNDPQGEGFMLGRITVLPQGKYTLKFSAKVEWQQGDFDFEKTVLKCGEQEIPFNSNNGDYQEYSFEIEVAIANTPYEFGIYQKEGGNANWAIMGGISLTLNSENIYPVPNTDSDLFTYDGDQEFKTNTWSTEGNTDNTNFLTPFNQLWVGSGNKLNNATIKNSYTPTETGVYKVSAWVRAYNESGGAITGAKIFVADVETDACTGTAISNGRLGTYTAMADGVAGTPFSYGFEIENAEINWLAFKNITITYLGDLPEEEITALMEQVPTGKMNAIVKTTLDEYVLALNTNKSVANYNALSLYLPTAQASANEYSKIEEAIIRYANEAEKLDENGKKVYDATNVQEKYDDGEYEAFEEAENELIAIIRTATLAQTTAGSDMTWAIENWDFLNCGSRNFPGWTIGEATTAVGSAAPKDDTTVEYWTDQATRSFDYYQELTGLPIGKYTIQASMWYSPNGVSGDSADGSAGVYGVSGDVEVYQGVDTDTEYPNFITKTTEEIAVYDGTLRIGVKNKGTMGARWFGVDWIKLTLEDYITVPVEFTNEAGYATFSSEYALDLANVEGGKAYIVTAKASEETIAITECTETVPAKTGIIVIKDGEDDVTIRVASNAEELKETNYLVATDGTEVTVGNYVLASDKDGNDVGFYILNAATTVQAGKAYLDADAVSTANPAKVLRIVFGDETATAIEAVATEAEADGAIYNVAGQQVGKDYKGIVIKNGKKYLNK